MTQHVSADEWRRLGSRMVPANGIELQVVEHGDGPLVVLCHGFPELAFSWRHQAFALAEAGFRVLALDMRGYGGSSRPADVGAYDILSLCADLVGVLDDVGADDAIFAGHDWGAAVVWHLALAHPERVRAVAGLSVPITPRSAAPPMSILRSRLGDDFYMAWFQEPGVADAALAKNARSTLVGEVVLTEQDWLARADTQTAAPAWLSDAELDHYVQTFDATGFTGGLNYYRNIDRNWEITEHLADRKITQPSLFLTGTNDPVRRFMPADKLTSVATDLRENIVLGGGHWIQQERPDEVNGALIRFARSVGD